MATARTRAAAHSNESDDDGANAQNWGVRVGNPPDDEPIEETAQDRVSAMLQDLRDTQTAKVRLYRMNPQTKKLAWCCDYTPEEFEAGGFESIRSLWGAGSYEVRVYGQNDGGKHCVLGRSQIELMAVSPTAPQPVAAANSELSQILARMAEQQATQNAAILQALQNKPDPIAGLKETFGLMSMMREAMGLNNQPAQKSSIGEIIEAIKELQGAKELISPDKPEADPDNPMTMLPQFIELAKMAMQKNQTPETAAFPMMNVPPSVLTPSMNPAPSMQLQSPQLSAAPVETPINPETQQMEFIAALRAQFAELVSMAQAAAADPSAQASIVQNGAEFVYENIPDEFVEILRGDNWFGALQSFAPEITEHQPYFTLVRDAALTIFAEEAANNEGDASTAG